MIINRRAYLTDFFRLALVFWGKPAFNYLNILIKFQKSRITRKVYTAKTPFAFSAEVSSKCNLSCPECNVGTGKTKREKAFMDIAIFQKLLQETRGQSFYVNLYFQGEPFLNKQLFEFITKAKENKFYTVASTNAHFFNEKNNESLISSNLDRLIVSLDGTSAETYNYYRKNGDFNKVITGIKSLTRHKKDIKSTHPFIVLQFLVHSKNEHELQHIKSFAKELGVDLLQIKTMQFLNKENIERLSPSKEKYRRYNKSADGNWHVRKKRSKACFRLWSQAVITSDGNVVPCCYDKTPGIIAGNIKESDIGKIWKSETLNNLRDKLLKGDKLPVMCSNCYG